MYLVRLGSTFGSPPKLQPAKENEIANKLENINNFSDDNLYMVDNYVYHLLANNKLLGLGDITKCAAVAYTLSQKIKKMGL